MTSIIPPPPFLLRDRPRPSVAEIMQYRRACATMDMDALKRRAQRGPIMPPPGVFAVWVLALLLVAMSSCQTLQPIVDKLQDQEAACKAAGGAFILDKGCVMPTPTEPPAPEPGPPPSPGPAPAPPGPAPATGQACADFGHTGPAVFRKSLDTPAPQLRVEVDEMAGRPLEAGRITAEVTGFGLLASADRDSFFMLIETMRPGGYRVVFSGDTWRHGADMMTRWTVQHFPPGAQRMEPMGEFEHWLFPEKKYLYDCSWDQAGAGCRVSQAEEGWSADRAVEIKAPLGELVKPLIFGDHAAEAYQRMGPDATVLRACLSIY